MEELQQSNQELYEVVSQLAESNRNFEQRLYTLERVIGIREERIRFLEEELNNAIELSTQEKEELIEEISKLKRIVHQLEEENKRKDKEISNKDRLISEFDERETKLKTRIQEISKSAGNTPKAQDYTTRLVDENERLKREINTIRAWNFGENEYDSDENSLDLYNSDNMGTIAELADAIDRSLDNTTICRTILANQIKRSTRAIRRKYTNLQQDLAGARPGIA
ncbi:hypothetical protein C2G38_2040322 [Gigaspora rosea]|uniref:Uncharacterized protein n=1 Tax=Gigaspora rosea TaxID=44941 RepID=A0A397UYL0_9GLOM|nr:hypothetical protein C2G38_2040322 [Gigaspora rosea]